MHTRIIPEASVVMKSEKTVASHACHESRMTSVVTASIC